LYDKIVELIKKDMNNKKDKYIANKYYYYKPKSKEDNIVNTTNANGDIITINLNKSCNININYFKLLVNQKIDYLLAKVPTFSPKNYTKNQLVELFETMMLNASLDVVSWLHFYVENNKLDWIIIHDVEIIPLYDTHNKNIIGIIRYYETDKETIQVEQWSVNGVEISIIKEDKLGEVQELSHYKQDTIYQDEIVDTQYYNFTFIPFVPLYNNRNKESDMEGIQELLDYYNQVSSGFIDNIDKFQEALMKLKGFSGDSSILEQTMKDLKRYKMVGLPEDGDVDYIKVEIPVEARKVILDLLKENIFKLGRGFDEDNLGDGNITNIVIKSRYSKLDAKANGCEKQLKLFYEKFVECENKYYNNNENSDLECNRTQLFNASEMITDCVNATDLVLNGLLSKETLIKNNPWVTDFKQELKLIDKENQNDNSGQNLPNDNSGQNLPNVNQGGQ